MAGLERAVETGGTEALEARREGERLTLVEL